eukprot:1996896-Pyramimonas_sp.AAC.2
MLASRQSLSNSPTDVGALVVVGPYVKPVAVGVDVGAWVGADVGTMVGDLVGAAVGEEFGIASLYSSYVNWKL